MADLCQDGLRCNPNDLRQAMSIHTRKITDSCRDKDCIEDLPVYLTAGSQRILESSANTRVRCAELMNTYIDVEPVAFDKSHYCIDITFYYRILADTIVGANRPAALCGVAVFTKRVVLCGEESCAHIYQRPPEPDRRPGPEPVQRPHRRGRGPGPHGPEQSDPGDLRVRWPGLSRAAAGLGPQCL